MSTLGSANTVIHTEQVGATSWTLSWSRSYRRTPVPYDMVSSEAITPALEEDLLKELIMNGFSFSPYSYLHTSVRYKEKDNLSEENLDEAGCYNLSVYNTLKRVSKRKMSSKFAVRLSYFSLNNVWLLLDRRT